jgi:ATP-dependent DNA helicase RecG
MDENPSITREELAELLGITSDGVKYHIDNLRKQGVIKRIGGRKAGAWKIRKKDD